MEIPANFRFTGFYDLLADAVYQHKLANQCDDSYLMNRHARASISASILTLESASNCLIRSLEISSSFAGDLDKLPLLAKIEAYLGFRNIEKFDRGRNEVQRVVELVRARNDYVHTKAMNIKTDVSPMEKAGKHWKLPMSLHGDQWKAVGIPKRAMFWSANDSLSVLKVVVEFYMYLFVELMQADADQLQELLASRLEIKDVHILTLFDEFKAEFKEASVFGVDLSFLGVCETDLIDAK